MRMTGRVKAAAAGAARKTVRHKRAPETDRLVVTALTRGLQLLMCFRRDREALGTTELARLTGLSQPTVWRLCYTLCKSAFLVRTADEKLRLGPAATMLAHSAGANLDICGVARPRMQALADRYQAAVGIAIRDELDMVLVERCQGNAPVVLNLRVGTRVPIATTSYGWAYLAALSSTEREALIELITRSEPDRWASLGAHIARAVSSYSSRGFTVNCGVFNANINGVGVSLRYGGCIYCLSVAGPASVLPRRMLENEVGAELRALGQWLVEESAARSGSVG